MKHNGKKDLLVGPIDHNKAELTCAFIFMKYCANTSEPKGTVSYTCACGTAFLAVIRCNGKKLTKAYKAA
jgi:hypothetical protein